MNYFSVALLPDDDWQEEHKRLAGLDEKDGLGFGEQGIGTESRLGVPEDSSSTRLPSSDIHLSFPSSISSLRVSASFPEPPPPGQWYD